MERPEPVKRQVRKAILEAIDKAQEENRNVSWSAIKDCVENAGFSGNWMAVRNVLQCLINNGVCVRTDNIFKEEYMIL